MLNEISRLNAIRSALRTKAGVEPSHHWLTDCLDALLLESQHHPGGNSDNNNNNDTTLADECLYQILHHDLRDVIRTFDDDDDDGESRNNAPSSTSSLPSVQLRKAIQESRKKQENNNGNHGCKTMLPASFRLLVQMEEFLDVSQNATTRLEVGPASSNAPAPTGSQTNRCLKLAFSDGYHPITGLAQHYCSDDDEQQQQQENLNSNHPTTTTTRTGHPSTGPAGLLVAMEVAVIPQMSSNSHAGLKVLLTGPISVRHGVLLLHPGNAIVLGGHVPELVKLQQEALEQAKRVAGIGVDPTIRALIGTNPIAEEDEDGEDRANQGEHESRDVEPAHPPTFQTAATTIPTSTATFRASSTALPPPVPSPVVHSTAMVPSNRNNQYNTFTASANSLERSNTYPPQTQPTAVSDASSNYTGPSRSSYGNSITATTLTATAHAISAAMTTTMTPQNTATTANAMDVEMIVVDDDDDDFVAAATMATGTTDVNSLALSGKTRPNPYASTANHSNPYSPAAPTQTNIGISPGGGGCIAPYNPYAVPSTRGGNGGGSTVITAPASTVATIPPTPQMAARSTTPSALLMASGPATVAVAPFATSTQQQQQQQQQRPLFLSFEELRILMVRIRDSPTLYQQYLGRTFVSSVRQVGVRLDFNIVKVKKPSSDGGGGGSSSSKKKGSKHYEYLLICRFGGKNTADINNHDDGSSAPPPLLLTCQVSSALQEPYFGLPPKEMRELSRTNQERAKFLVKEGGGGIAKAFATCQPYELTLVEQDAMPTELDGNKPVLLLIKKHVSE
ncbi:hypothetical protein ACA910_000868 [Epithemia clementina (nom. ined.)]